MTNPSKKNLSNVIQFLKEELIVCFYSSLLFYRTYHHFVYGLFAASKTFLAFRFLNGLICGSQFAGNQIDSLYVMDLQLSLG